MKQSINLSATILEGLQHIQEQLAQSKSVETANLFAERMKAVREAFA